MTHIIAVRLQQQDQVYIRPVQYLESRPLLTASTIRYATTYALRADYQST
jgi:hypothetical protein